jgi:anti-sigma B factor antagonist
MKTKEKLGTNSTSEGMLSYSHLHVEKSVDMIVVRLGKHRVLDELTADKISDELFRVADRPDCNRLLLDFSGVVQLSSAMLAKLIRLHRKMGTKGEKLGLSGINSGLRSAFAITRLDRLFDITDEDAGVRMIQEPKQGAEVMEDKDDPLIVRSP